MFLGKVLPISSFVVLLWSYNLVYLLYCLIFCLVPLLNQTILERIYCYKRCVLYRNAGSNKPLQMISQQQYQDSERDRECVNGDEDAEWSDWTEETGDRIVCLLCPLSVTSWEDINNHLIVEHDIHYEQLTASLDFYQQVCRWAC